MLKQNTKKILLVEDEVLIAMVEEQELRSRGYDVIHTTKGEEAVKVVCAKERSKEGLIDLVLMDIDLGQGIDGPEAARQILDHVDIPIVFLSSHTEPEIVEKTEQITSYGYVVKQSGITVLDASIKMAFKLFNAKQAFIEKERALEKSEKELQRTLDATTDGIWSWDFKNDVLYFSDNYYRMLDYEPGEFEANYENWVDLLHPDDREAALSAATEYLKTKPDQYQNTFRLRTKTGEYRNLIASARVVDRDSDGEATYIIGNHSDITDQVFIQNRLQESEQRYKSFFMDNHSAMLIVAPATGKIVDANTAASQFYGWSHKVLTSMKIQDINQLTNEEIDREITRAQSEGRSFFRFRHILSDKTVRNVDVYSGPVTLDGKEYSYSIIHDITDIYKAEKERHALYEASRSVLECGTFLESARVIFDLCCEVTGAVSGYVALLSDNGKENELMFLEAGGLPCKVDPSLPMPIRGLRAEAYKTGKVVYENDFLQSEWLKNLPSGHVQLQNVLFAPLSLTGKVVGVIGIANKPEDFDENDARIVKAMGDIAAIAFHREQVEEELKESHKELLEGQRLANIGTWTYNIVTGQPKWSEEMFEIWGLDPMNEAPHYAEHAKYIHPEDFGKFDDAVRKAIEDGVPYNLELRICQPDGEIRAIRSICEPVFNNKGSVSFLRGTVQDITLQKEFEKHRAIEEAQYKTLDMLHNMFNEKPENLFDFIIEASKEVTASEYSFFGLLNDDESEMTIHAWSRNIMSSCKIAEQRIQFSIEESGIWGNCVRQRKTVIYNDYNQDIPSKHGVPSGHVPITRYIGIPVFEGDRIVAVGAVANKAEDYDVHDAKILQAVYDRLWSIIGRKKAEEALRESEARYRAVFANSHTPMLVIDPETGAIHDANPAATEFYGWDYDTLTSMAIQTINALSSDEVQAEMLRAKKEVRNFFCFQHRVASGELKEVEVYSGPIRTHGKDLLYSIIHDVSERSRLIRYTEFHHQVLSLINSQKTERDLIDEIIHAIQEFSGFEAVAIRIKDGEDYPYYITTGLPAQFVEAERFLCSRDLSGNIERDSEGNPCLECMCGNVLCGRTNPEFPFFTEGGSFWSNNTSKLLSETTEEERQTRTRNRCNGEGYESVALIPIKTGSQVIGLLQCNDTRTGCFSSHMIQFLEDLCESIAIAFQRISDRNKVDKINRDLIERVKELNCHYELSRFAERSTDITEILTKLPFLLKEAMSFPALTEVGILWNSQRYTTDKYKESEKKIYADIVVADEINGIIEINLNDRRTDKITPAFHKEEQKLLDTVAERIGRMIERISTGKDFSHLLAMINEAVIFADSEGIIKMTNQAAADLCGYSSPDALIGIPMTSLYACPESRSLILEKLERSGGEFKNFNFQLKKNDGTLIQTLCNIQLLKDIDGRVMGTLGALRDVSDLKQMQDDLHRKNWAIESSLNALAMADLEGKLIYVNPSFLFLWGYSEKKEVFGRRATEFWNAEGEANEVIEALHTRGGWKGQMTAKRRNEELFSVDVAASMVTDENGAAICMFAAFKDVTEKIQIEKALRESEEKYRKLTERSRMGIGISKGKEIVYANQALLDIFQIDDLETFREKSLLEYMTAESRQRTIERMQKVSRGEDVPEVFVHDIIRSDGEIRTLELSVNFVTINGEDCRQSTFIDITERLRAENALRESEEKYRRLFENAPFLIMEVDADSYEIVSCNAAMATAFGVSPGEIEGRNIKELLPEEVMNAREQYVLMALEQEKIQVFEDERNGRFFQNIFIPSVRGDHRYIETITTDITDLRVVQKELSDSLDALHNITDNMFDMVSLTNTDGTIIYASPSHEWILGYAPDVLIDGNILEFVHPEDLDDTLAAISELKKSQSAVKHEFRYRTENGDYLWLESIAKTQIDVNGGLSGMIISSRDISERKKAQSELENLVAEKKNLLKELNHRIKNSFNVILGILNMKSADIQNVDCRFIAQDIMHRIETISNLYSLLSNTGASSRINLRAYCASIIDSVQTAYSRAAGRISINVECESIEVDAENASTVGICINEIITNSYKYAFPDEREGEIGVILKGSEDGILLTIWDDGVGLSEGKDAENGHGFGLTLIHGMIKMANGDISVDSTNGLKYTLRIPVPV